MQVYEFTAHLIEQLDESQAGIDRLFEAGLDDASPATSNRTSIVIFHREAESLEEAIKSGISDLQRAGYRVARIETDETATISRINAQLQQA